MNPMMDLDLQIAGIKKTVTSIREKRGKSESTLKVLDNVIKNIQDLIVSLLLEKHLLYQHQVMEELAKNKPDAKKKEAAIHNMYIATIAAEKYVRTHKLTQWDSRINRCLGRVADYKGEYMKAIKYYKLAIKTCRKDPEYTVDKTPRWLEYEAYLAYSVMMLGEVDKGMMLSRKIYRKFLTDKHALDLKKRDYPTWAIWITGIPIRAARAVVELEQKGRKQEIVGWLNEAYKLIETPIGSNKWIGKVDFGFRKQEINNLLAIIN